MTTFEKIQAIIVEHLGKTKEEVTLTTHIKSDLNADSLDIFQVINEIEETFAIIIDTAVEFETIEDLVACVDMQIAENTASTKSESQ